MPREILTIIPTFNLSFILHIPFFISPSSASMASTMTSVTLVGQGPNQGPNRSNGSTTQRATNAHLGSILGSIQPNANVMNNLVAGPSRQTNNLTITAPNPATARNVATPATVSPQRQLETESLARASRMAHHATAGGNGNVRHLLSNLQPEPSLVRPPRFYSPQVPRQAVMGTMQRALPIGRPAQTEQNLVTIRVRKVTTNNRADYQFVLPPNWFIPREALQQLQPFLVQCVKDVESRARRERRVLPEEFAFNVNSSFIRRVR